MDELVEGGGIHAVVRSRVDCDYCDRKGFVYLPDAPFGVIKETDNLVSGGTEDVEEAVGRTSEFSTQAKEIYRPLELIIGDASVGNNLYAAVWDEGDGCNAAGFCPDEAIVAGQNDAFMAVLSTVTDKFDTTTTITTGLGVGNIITDIEIFGDLVVGTWTDNIDPTAATDGGVFIYQNGAVSQGLSGGAVLGIPMYGITKQGNNFIAVGQNGAVYQASRVTPLVWTQITNTLTTEDLVAIDADESTGVSYIASKTAEAYTLLGINLTDISANVKAGATPASLESVKVLGDDHVAFGGATGFFAEHRNASLVSATNQFTVQTLNSGTGSVNDIEGNSWRTFAAIASKIFERSIITLNEDVMTFLELELVSGAVAGNYMSLDVAHRFGAPNYLVAVTDTGEAIYAKPCTASC